MTPPESYLYKQLGTTYPKSPGIKSACNRFANRMGNAHDERIAHAKCSVYVRHAGIGPALREALQLIEFIWHQPTVPSA